MLEPTKLHVLYLDDDPDSREMVSVMLGLSDIAVSLAESSDEALELVREQKHDLYLLDGILASGDSLDVCREIRRLSPTTPIVFYSARGSRSDLELASEAGASLYILKPYFGDLVEAIERIVTQSGNAGHREAN